MQDRFERNNSIALLGFLLERLPKRFIDINLLRMSQELVNEANILIDKTLLNLIYEHLIFDFRIWNKADYEIRIGHVQYISTIVKDDKKYFRKMYGIQFFLDVIKTYFGKLENLGSSNNADTSSSMNDEDLRNLRNSFFGLIKYYAQKEIKVNEINALVSFLSTTKNVLFQNDLLDMLIAIIESPNASDQIYLLLFEPHMADGLYGLLTLPDLDHEVQRKLIKLIRILLKSKKVYDKSKLRLKLEDCGGYAGLISKIISEFTFYYQNVNRIKFNEHLVIDLLQNFLLDEATLTNYDSLWNIVSLLANQSTPLISDMDVLIKARLKLCEIIIGFLFTNLNSIKLLTKTPAWQDLVCQLLCLERKDPANNREAQQLPQVLVSSDDPCLKGNNYVEEMTVGNEAIDEDDATEVDDGDENAMLLHEDEVEWNPSILECDGKKNNLLKKLLSKSDYSLVTSTPSSQNTRVQSIENDSGDKEQKLMKKLKYNNKSTSSLVRKDSDAGKKEVSKDKMVKMNSMHGLHKQKRINNDSIYDGIGDLSGIQAFSTNKVYSLDLESEDGISKFKSNDSNSVPDAHFNRQTNESDAVELFEKLLYLIFKLLWEGVSGSNEEAWKVRVILLLGYSSLSLTNC